MSLATGGNDLNVFFFNTTKTILVGLIDRKWTQKTTFWPSWHPCFNNFGGPKKSFSGLLQSCFGVNEEVFELCSRKAYFWVCFHQESLINYPKNQNCRSKICSFLAFLIGNFWQFWGLKKVVLWTLSILFLSCVGSVWALFLTLKKSLTFVCIFMSKGS